MTRRFHLGRPSFRAHTALVGELLGRAGWQETKGEDWDLYWDAEPPTRERCAAAGPGKRYSHFLGVTELSIKTNLHDNLARARDALGPAGRALYDFFPLTFPLPEGYQAFLAEARARPEQIWIQKPRALSRGRGVELVADPEKVPREPDWLVQEYLARPQLLDGYKYTLRFYVLVPSLEPLVVYVFGDGFCKFTSRPYRLDAEGRADRFAHLTNPDVLKEDAAMPVSSRNLTHAQYRERIRAEGVDDAALFARIDRMLALTLVAAREPIRARLRAAGLLPDRLFDLLGLDVMIDADWKPWIIECNVCPSMSVEAAEASESARREHAVKRGVVAGALSILGYLDEGAPTSPWPATHAGWRRVAPAPGLLEAFPAPRPTDVALHRHLVGPPPAGPRLVPAGVHTAAIGAHRLLLQPASGRVLVLDPAGALIWQGVERGLHAEAIIAELAARFPAQHEAIVHDVWSSLADWHTSGLLAHAAAAPPAPPAPGNGVWATLAAELVLLEDEVALVVPGQGGTVTLAAPGEARAGDARAAIQSLLFPGATPADAEDPTLRPLPPAELWVRLAVEGALKPAPDLDAAGAQALVAWLASLDALALEPA